MLYPHWTIQINARWFMMRFCIAKCWHVLKDALSWLTLQYFKPSSLLGFCCARFITSNDVIHYVTHLLSDNSNYHFGILHFSGFVRPYSTQPTLNQLDNFLEFKEKTTVDYMKQTWEHIWIINTIIKTIGRYLLYKFLCKS